MIEPLLQQELSAVFRRQSRVRLALCFALCWGALAALGWLVILLNSPSAGLSPLWRFAFATLGIVVGVLLLLRHRRAQPDWHALARRIEQRHPELDGVLLTAVQQQPASDGELHYLQRRVVREALIHCLSHPWAATIPRWRVATAQVTHLLALAAFVCVLVALRSPGKHKSVFAGGWTADGVTVTPGDLNLERGERLVVMASFAGRVPAKVELVTTPAFAPPTRSALVKSLSDPVFGGSVSEVMTDLVYRVEYGDQHTRDFTVKVFEFPRLERADADLAFPPYTGLAPKRIDNTHRVSAVEGTRLDLTLQLNKPVARAQFVVKGDTSNVIPLVVASNSAVATLTGLSLETNRTYLLQLVDAEGRTNKLPAQFVLDVLRNREPELKIASPRGDTRPSALEEVSFEGTVWDDFGVQAFGLAYTAAGGEIKFIELGRNVPAKEKRAFQHLLRLEDLGAQPDQLITWFLWAEDIGPDGEVRRTAGDMYFAEVRPFDEIFRQGQSGGEGQGSGGEASGGGNRQSKLAELQKQIINATWKLQRQQTRQQPAAPSAKEHPADKALDKDRAIEAPLRRQAGLNSSTIPVKPGSAVDSRVLPHPGPLPLGEGESLSAIESYASRSSQDERWDNSNMRWLFPLPAGEGQDEGESLSVGPAGDFSLSVVSLPVQKKPEPRSRALTRTAFGQRAPGNSTDTPLRRTRERLSRLTATNQTASASQFGEDLGVVREAVAEALSQAQESRAQQAGSPNAPLWDDLIREMEKARAALEKAAASPPSLAEALTAEQAAFQVLLKLQQREYEVTRNRSRSRSQGSSRDQQMQRQLDQLDLTQPENRYETERLAQPPQSAERREQLQVMNRLGELARRQQDLNERLKELQTALQEAKTEQEREEIRRQLKRLQEEEQRMLADVDELQQRMNQPENQSRMNEQRQQLEQTREEMQRASEAAQQGSASQALASGTRAQRQLQEMREQLRQKNASAFAEDLKQLRSEAREAERRQQDLQKQVENFSSKGQKTLDDSQERQQSLDQLAQQAQRLTNLVQRATQLSEQTEEAEPLASRELYDSVRKFSQDDANSVRHLEDEFIQNGLVRTELYQRLTQLEKAEGVKSVELTREMLRQGLLPQAQQAGDRTRSAVTDLARGIERAAEKVLGDDTETLRQAQQQLDHLTGQVEREIAQGQGAGATNDQVQASSGRARQAQNQSEQGGAGERGTNAQPALAENQDQTQQSGGGRRGTNANPAATESQNQAQSGSPSESAQNQSSAQNQTGGQQTQGGEGAQQPGEQRERGNASTRNRDGQRGSRNVAPQRGGGTPGRLPTELEQFLSEGRGGPRNGAVIMGEDFVPWSDGLREVEEMVDDPLLQNRLATVRERARLLRQEFKRTREKPEWTEVRSQVVKPLVEVRNQIAEELARRGSRENLVPIDRDPVPNRYSELVRRYYEQLGKDK